MIEAGIVAVSDNSPFASPVVMVKKSNGEYRFCVDYRRLNMQTTTFCHELPCEQDVVDLVSSPQSTVYSVLDIRAAYFQLPATDSGISDKNYFCNTTPWLSQNVYDVQWAGRTVGIIVPRL